MKRISTIFLFSVCSAAAQSTPIGVSSLPTHILDWALSTPSGCNPTSPSGLLGPGICVGGGTSGNPGGDTMYATAWAANAIGMPFPTGLPLYMSMNDLNVPPCGGNIAIEQLSVFDWATPNASRMDAVNCFTSMNGANSPAGWYGKFSSSETGNGGAVWHSRGAFFRGGKLYFPIVRNPSSGIPTNGDRTILRSDDKGATWSNPYTVSISGTPQANGDGPLCGATSPTDTCRNANYAASIMWQNAPGGFIPQAVEYMQDGATPPAGINDGCAPAIWTCFMSVQYEGTIMRVLNSLLPRLLASDYQYYTCPAITDKFRCDGSLSSSWSYNFADRTPAGLPSGLSWLSSVTYHPEFHSYMSIGNEWGMVFAWAPAIYGPWTVISNTGPMGGLAPQFTSIPLALKQVISTNPPHSLITVASDTALHAGSGGSSLFTQWDVTLGKVPGGTGEAPVFNLLGQPPGSVIAPVHSGVIFSDDHAPGTIPRNGLQWLFDFYDMGVIPARATDVLGLYSPGYHDIANGTGYLMPCSTSGALCDWIPGQGTTPSVGYASTNAALRYDPYLMSMRHETPDTIGAAGVPNYNLSLTNAPQAMQGNGTYTVTGVFRKDSGTTGVLWSTGGASLQYGDPPSGLGTTLNFAWGGGNAITSAFNLVAGNWYFIAVTVTANGTNPTIHAWAGNAGAIADQMPGATRTGSAAPSVSAAPMLLGSGASASFAWFSVHSRALSQPEVDLMYRTVKAKMTARGVAIQ